MVTVIAFLSVTNIAMGYALAVYINRNFGTFTVNRGGDASIVVVNTSTSTVVDVPPAMAGSSEVAQAAVESASEPIDEENVLAGIEAFRSQLAKMSGSAEIEAAEPVVENAQAELASASAI